MAGMQRFITYIYAYENGEKNRNVGFAKIEVRGDNCRIEVHLRDLFGAPEKSEIYFFHEKEGKLICYPIGEVILSTGKSDFNLGCKTTNIGESKKDYSDMEGIVIKDRQDMLYLTRWIDGEKLAISLEKMKIYHPEAEKSEEKEDEKNSEENDEEKSESHIVAENIENDKKVIEDENKEKMEEHIEPFYEAEPDLQVTEVPMRNVFPQYGLQDVWEKMKDKKQKLSLYKDQKIECLKIELKDLRDLPKDYWYLGNNSFLLHGFFNYRYLVWGKLSDDQFFLGIPGIYQQQERVMAAIFGFPEFIVERECMSDGEENMESTKETKSASTKREAEPLHQFGYWCHIL